MPTEIRPPLTLVLSPGVASRLISAEMRLGQPNLRSDGHVLRLEIARDVERQLRVGGVAGSHQPTVLLPGLDAEAGQGRMAHAAIRHAQLQPRARHRCHEIRLPLSQAL